MKKARLIIYISPAILAIAGLFAAKAEKRAGVTCGRFVPGNMSVMPLDSAHYTTVKGILGKTVAMVTVGGSVLAILYTCPAALKKVYFH